MQSAEKVGFRASVEEEVWCGGIPAPSLVLSSSPGPLHSSLLYVPASLIFFFFFFYTSISVFTPSQVLICLNKYYLKLSKRLSTLKRYSVFLQRTQWYQKLWWIEQGRLLPLKSCLLRIFSFPTSFLFFFFFYFLQVALCSCRMKENQVMGREGKGLFQVKMQAVELVVGKWKRGEEGRECPIFKGP